MAGHWTGDNCLWEKVEMVMDASLAERVQSVVAFYQDEDSGETRAVIKGSSSLSQLV